MMNGFIKSDNWVPKLIIVNIIIYFLQGILNNQMIIYYFGLTPNLVLGNGYIWQIVSYMFLHGSMFHIFLNMYALLLFGSHIEHLWGSKKFMLYYFFTGVGAGFLILGINMAAGEPAASIPTIGASGAVFGLLLAFGVLFPDVEILLFFILPIKAKFLVIMYGAVEFYSLVTMGTSSSVSHVGHLGGIIFGLIFFFIMRRRGIEFKAKKVKARINKEIRSREARITAADSSGESMLKLLDKLKREGSEALTDDEYQILKHFVIMTEASEEICVPEDFDTGDKHCLSCEAVDACIAREIKRYL